MKRFRGGLNEKWRKNGVVLDGIVSHHVGKIVGRYDWIGWHCMVWEWYGMECDGMEWHLMVWDGLGWYRMEWGGMAWYKMSNLNYLE